MRTDHYGWAAMAALFGACCLALGGLMIAAEDVIAGTILLIGGTGGLLLGGMDASHAAAERKNRGQRT